MTATSTETALVADPTPRRRGIRRAFADRLVTSLMKTPPASNTYTVQQNLPVTTRDGATLLVDHFAPVGPSKGTILIRSPYGWTMLYSTVSGGGFASRGYDVVLARTRGTFGSGGDFEPFQNEVNDAVDTVAWLREQPWFDGNLATYGASYVGFTQWALLMEPPAELKTAIIATAPHDFRASIYDRGAFNIDTFLSWSETTSRQEVPLFTNLRNNRKVAPLIAGAKNEVPLIDAAERLMPGRAPWYPDWVANDDPDAEIWRRMDMTEAVRRADIPILLHAGWQDVFIHHMFESYDLLRERHDGVAMTIGPWTHAEYVTKGQMPMNESLAWFDEHLGGDTTSPRGTAVKAFVAGAAQTWTEAAEWPPPSTALLLHPTASGKLDTAASTGSSGFVYDPEVATPSVGGTLLAGGGYVDDSALAERPDVLTFTGDPLPGAVRMIGTPRARIAHTTDNPHADLWVRISDMGPDGVSRNVTDGFVRLDPAAANGEIDVRLDETAYEFAEGHRIRLLIAGGSHPHWMRNLGTGENPATSARMVPSRREIDLAGTSITLPVVEIGR